MTQESLSLSPPVAKSARWPAIDALRGVALIAMIIYHFAWDLSFYRFIETDIARDPLWSRFAMATAGSFLFLVGVGFAFAATYGLDRERYWRRLAMIAGAALAVSIATVFAMPQAPVLFGILHCIALSSVLALLFLRAPIALVAASAVVALALPLFARSSFFDGAWWVWLGLARTDLAMVDHVPVLPWFGCVLAGLALARLMLETDALAGLRAFLRDWRPRLVGRALVAMGRWSLLIYLLHQPILMTLLWPIAPSAAPPVAIDDGAGFRSGCEQQCRAQANTTVEICRTFCDCAHQRLRGTPMWANIMRDRINAEEQAKVEEIQRQCIAAQRPAVQ